MAKLDFFFFSSVTLAVVVDCSELDDIIVIILVDVFNGVVNGVFDDRSVKCESESDVDHSVFSSEVVSG